MKKLLVAMAVCTTLWSCDYGYNYCFLIENASGKQIEMTTSKPSFPTDLVSVVAPGERKEVYSEFGGICGKRYVPEDVFREDDLLPSGIVYRFTADNEPVPADLRRRDKWEYSAREYLAIYTLVITDELLAQ